MAVGSPQAKRQRRCGREDPDDPISSESQASLQLDQQGQGLAAAPGRPGLSADGTGPDDDALELTGFADGACRGNPGRASWGAVLWTRNGGSSASLLWEGMGVLEGSKRTNNEAEYTGAIMCVEQAIARRATSLHLSLDSELVVKQYTGEYAVNSPTLQILHRRLLDLGSRLRTLELRHIPRQDNARADALANKALDGCATAASSGSGAINTFAGGWPDHSSERQPKPHAVSFLDQPSSTPPAELFMHSHSSYPGTQYPSDDDVLLERPQTEGGSDSGDGPKAPLRSAHGQWRKLREVTIEWAASCRSTRGPFATVLGLVTHVVPPHEMPRRDGSGSFLMAKLRIEDGSRPEDKTEITFWREHSCQVDKIQCGDIVQISQVYFKRWKDRSTDEVRFGGNVGEMSEVIVACRAGDTPPQTGHLPLHRVYSRADLVGLHQWALTSAWRGYLDQQRPPVELVDDKVGGPVTWQQCTTASELSRAVIDKEDGLVCFGGRFSKESVLRFHRDRRATIELLEQEASAEKHMPSMQKAAKLREKGGAALSRGVRLVITDGRTVKSSGDDVSNRFGAASPSAGLPSTGSVVVAVHHPSKAIFHTAVTEDRCYVLTALRRAGEEESSEALEPVLHTTAATTLTSIDPPNALLVESSSAPTMKPARAWTVLEVIQGLNALTHGVAFSFGSSERACAGQKPSLPDVGADVTVSQHSLPPLVCQTSDRQSEKQPLIYEADDDGCDDDDDDDEHTQTLSLDSAVLDSASDSEIDERTDMELPELPDSEANDTMQMLDAEEIGVESRSDVARSSTTDVHLQTGLGDQVRAPTADCVDDSSRAATHAPGAGVRGRVRCAAYVRSTDLEACIPAATPLGPSSRTADENADAGWLSLLRWRCARPDCSRQVPLSPCHKGEPFRGTSACDRCGGDLQLSLRDMTMVLSDCPRHCERGHGGNTLARSEALTVAVLPCAIPSLFCGLVTPEQVYGDHEILPHSDTLGRAQVREAIWALCNSGTRLTFELECTQPGAGSTDSQGYGTECSKASRGTPARYAIAAVDWDTGSPLDCGCGCTERNPSQVHARRNEC